MTKQEIAAIKEYVRRRSIWMSCGDEICPNNCYENLKAAGQALDNLAEDK